MNLKNTLQAGDDIERSVLSNIMIFCTQLTFDLILSHRNIFRLCIHPYRFNYTYWNIFSKDASFYPILPSEVVFFYLDCQPFGKVCHNSRIKSWLECMQGALRVVLCTKKLHFDSGNWRMENKFYSMWVKLY